MISKPRLKTLVKRYSLDARVLLNNRRYASAIYLSGYAIELAFKYRICKLFAFNSGYPENNAEFDRYVSRSKKSVGTYIKDIRDLKIHDLSKLKAFSGEQLTIDGVYFSEWEVVKNWSVILRYDGTVIRKKRAAEFHQAAQRILSLLIKK